MEEKTEALRQLLEELCASAGVPIESCWSLRVVLSPPVLAEGHHDPRRVLFVGEKDGPLHRLGIVKY